MVPRVVIPCDLGCNCPNPVGALAVLSGKLSFWHHHWCRHPLKVQAAAQVPLAIWEGAKLEIRTASHMHPGGGGGGMLIDWR